MRPAKTVAGNVPDEHRLETADPALDGGGQRVIGRGRGGPAGQNGLSRRRLQDPDGLPDRRLAASLTDRAHADARGSSGHGRRAGPADAPLPRGSNTVVSAGAATSEELIRRLGNGLWIEEIGSGTVELSSGRFRLAFPRGRRVRRGPFAVEIGAGFLAGEILPALSAVEPMIGRDVRACRSLGWCSRAGQVVPVGGEAPDVIVRRLSVRDR